MVSTTQPEKTKTKAKQRYLKVKRERRKKANVKSNLSSGRAGISQPTQKFQEEEEESGNSSDAAVSDHEPEDFEILPNSVPISASSPDEIMGDPLAPKLVPPERVLDLAPLAAFPMPAAPPAASQTTLALQGLDPGLVDAEVIDAARIIPIDSSDSEPMDPMSTLGLSLKTRKRLKELGIVELFAVQTALLPFLLPRSSQRKLYMPYDAPRDVCVSAPTGSGKTLAYVLPILELLSSRVVTRLRALVVLPTRDLVTQVRETFEAVCKGRGLKIGIATGQHSFAHEQAQLVEDSSSILQGGSSKVDILICTPGRLIDHLKGTRNFSLQHLRFLVIDEADRLLTQSFQDWLAQVLSAARPPTTPSSSPSNVSLTNTPPRLLPHHDAVSPAWLPTPHSRSHIDEKRETSCQKLLFSATLTRDPAKISALDLREAKYFVVKDSLHESPEGGHVFAGETFVFPATLKEHMIVCTSVQKPLIFFHLVHHHSVTNALVFTKSAESTARLVRLFKCFENAMGHRPSGPVAHAYSSDLSAAERKTILDKFKSQEITILVCSDLISRGIDISHVSHVVSYDAPVDMRKYVHRVGRTARAGRDGDAWSLIEEQEARYFKSMLTDANHLAKVPKVKVTEDDLKPLQDYYEEALKKYSARGEHNS